MAVFTTIRPQEAQHLMDELGLGRLLSLRGITSGIENTNYFADTDQGCYVLTIFERLSFEQLPFYLGLMKHLAVHGISVPEPKAGLNRQLIHTIQGKPCAVVTYLAGGHVMQPNAQHCASVASMLARMHLAGQTFPLVQPNLRGLSWWLETALIVHPYLNNEQQALMDSELLFQQKLHASTNYNQLVRGPIHADLFRDNVMFSGQKLTGFFDFYFAGVDTFAFDIAVCLNDWCIDPSTGCLSQPLAEHFVRAYHQERALSMQERELLPALLRSAALRFWLSRLWDHHLPRPASMLVAHDPVHFEKILRDRIAQIWRP
jgi:homoserine kinase type II